MVLKAFVLAMMMILSVSADHHASTVLPLHRVTPANNPLDLQEIKAQDESRRFTVPNFPLQGSADLRSTGLYYTKVKLGTPATELAVMIDSGSNVLWVNCKCKNCPQSTAAANSSLNFFDATTSSTATFDTCSGNPKCSQIPDTKTASGCSTDDNRCRYLFGYVVGTVVEGYYISDLLTYSTSYPEVTTASASINFGCGFNQTGPPIPTGMDGILGLGQESFSIVSQLYKKGITPNVFSHCLRGDANGGGTLVLGEAIAPSMVYTPLLKSGSGDYRVNMESISVGATLLPMSIKEILVDSGNTLAYLWPEVYDPFVNAIKSIAAKSGVPASSQGTWSYCFSLTSSVKEIFPQVRLNFAGGASMVLEPQDYLVQPEGGSDSQWWCVGFQKATSRAGLGDIVLKDKIIVYDIARQRLGMASYNCLLPLNILTTSGANNAARLSMLSVILIGIVTLFCLISLLD